MCVVCVFVRSVGRFRAAGRGFRVLFFSRHGCLASLARFALGRMRRPCPDRSTATTCSSVPLSATLTRLSRIPLPLVAILKRKRKQNEIETRFAKRARAQANLGAAELLVRCMVAAGAGCIFRARRLHSWPCLNEATLGHGGRRGGAGPLSPPPSPFPSPPPPPPHLFRFDLSPPTAQG